MLYTILQFQNYITITIIYSNIAIIYLIFYSVCNQIINIFILLQKYLLGKFLWLHSNIINTL